MSRWLPNILDEINRPHQIPPKVTPQDCRHLFKLEAELSGNRFFAFLRPPAVIVAGETIILRWEYLGGAEGFVCHPVGRVVLQDD